jgi:DNA-binding NarL/FixJ family response regulator
VKPIRVLLADDHALVRAGIRVLIQEIEGVQVVAEASNGQEALSLIEAQQPDLVLLDITMPGPNGLEVLEQTAKAFPQTRVIVLTVHEGEEYVTRALRAGAAGYLPKSAAGAELELAIKAVVGEGIYISPEISKRIFLEHSNGASAVRGSVAALTPRQGEVLRMIAEGFTTKGIAHNLNISVKTVETHRATLMERLNIHDVAGLVRYAIKMGLVTIEE